MLVGAGVIPDDGLGLPGAFTLIFAAGTGRCGTVEFAAEFAVAWCKKAGDALGLVSVAGGVCDDLTTEDTALERPSLEATRADLSKNFLY